MQKLADIGMFESISSQQPSNVNVFNVDPIVYKVPDWRNVSYSSFVKMANREATEKGKDAGVLFQSYMSDLSEVTDKINVARYLNKLSNSILNDQTALNGISEILMDGCKADTDVICHAVKNLEYAFITLIRTLNETKLDAVFETEFQRAFPPKSSSAKHFKRIDPRDNKKTMDKFYM